MKHGNVAGLYGHKLELSIFLFVTLLFSMMSNLTIAQTSDDKFSMMSSSGTIAQTSDDDNASGVASTISSTEGPAGILQVVSNSEGHLQTLEIPSDQMIFNITPIYDSEGNQASYQLSLKPELSDFYQQAGLFDKPKDTVFIYPSFTQAAYGTNGFYYHYRKQCDTSCLTVPIPDYVHGSQASSIVTAWILKLLGYPYLKDQDVDKNPDILKQYKRVIVLHSEYVTQTEFDAITSHPNVIFLYPNALYAKVTANYTNNTITLIRGHGYPDASIRNGFGWAPDNTKYEYNVQCNNWHFYLKDNATFLNCYPEYHVLVSKEMLLSLQEGDPTTITDDVTNWLMYPQDQNGTEQLLDDFGVTGSTIPPWVEKPALLLQNGDISKRDFGGMLQYLSSQKIIK
jgi:hypothetical protein